MPLALNCTRRSFIQARCIYTEGENDDDRNRVVGDFPTYLSDLFLLKAASAR